MDPLQRTALHPSFICNFVFAWWHFCFCRMLPSGVSFEIALPTKIHPLKHHNKKLLCMKCNAFCEKSTSFPGICYLTDFIDIAHTMSNFVRRTKLFVFQKRDQIFLKYQSFSSNQEPFMVSFKVPIQLVLSWHRTVQNLLFSGIKYLKIAEGFRLNIWIPQEGSHHYPYETKSMIRPC